MTLPIAFVFNHISTPDGRQLNLSTLAIVRSLGRRKIKVVLVTTTRNDSVINSRYCDSAEICPSMYDDEESLVNFFMSLANKYSGDKVLIPSVDECAYFIGKYHKDLSRHYNIPAPDWEAVSLVNNKKNQYDLAEKLNIPVPETYYPKSIDDVSTLAHRINNYPYVIKPTVSFEWKVEAMRSKSKGKKGIRADNADELIDHAKEIFVPGYDFMIQEVIGGRDERLITFLSYCDSGGNPISYFVRKKIRQCPVDFGYCTMTESCHNDIVVKQSVELLKALKFHGVSGVEWKLDPETDSYKLIEINARSVNTTGCAIAAGVDLPSIAYFDAIGDPLPTVTDWEDGCRWAWLSMDFWAGRQLINEGKLSFGEWFKSVKAVRADAVFSRDDLGFSLQYYFSFVWSVVISKVKKTLVRTGVN